jgi:hypothetical protein
LQVLTTLNYMSKRVDTITTITRDVDDLQQVLLHLNDATKKRLPETHAVRPTPPRRLTSGNSLAFTPMVKLRPNKSLDLPAALQDALRHAGVPFYQDSSEALQDTLIHAQLEHEKKLHDHYVSTSTSSHDRLAERSSKADSDLQVIHDALYRHAPFQQVHLTDPKLDEQLKLMEMDLEDKDRELLEAEGNELSLSDPRVRAFVAKYGR